MFAGISQDDLLSDSYIIFLKFSYYITNYIKYLSILAEI